MPRWRRREALHGEERNTHAPRPDPVRPFQAQLNPKRWQRPSALALQRSRYFRAWTIRRVRATSRASCSSGSSPANTRRCGCFSVTRISAPPPSLLRPRAGRCAASLRRPDRSLSQEGIRMTRPLPLAGLACPRPRALEQSGRAGRPVWRRWGRGSLVGRVAGLGRLRLQRLAFLARRERDARP